MTPSPYTDDRCAAERVVVLDGTTVRLRCRRSRDHEGGHWQRLADGVAEWDGETRTMESGG